MPPLARRLGCPALAVAVLSLLALPSAAPAAALVVPAENLTWGVQGHGTIAIDGQSPTCVGPATNPQSTKISCTSVDESTVDTCEDDGAGGSVCTFTVRATAPAGWSFTGWSGDCTGSSTTCELTASVSTFEAGGHPPITTEYFSNDVTANFVDTHAPVASFVSPTPAAGAVVIGAGASAVLNYQTDEDAEGPGWKCTRDGVDYSTGTFGSCSPAHGWSGLPDGVHTFCAQARDPSGLTSSVICRSWDQEVPPDASFAGGPADGTTIETATAAFSFTSNKAGRADGATVTYQCKLDAAPGYTTCPSSYTSPAVAPGPHTMSVESVFQAPLDASGVVHTSAPAQRGWTYHDVTAPTVTFAAPTPAEGSTAVTATPRETFAFSADEPASFQCRLDGGAYAACASPATRVVSNGTHDFWVLATDGSGNLTELHRHFTQATIPPDTTIAAGPAPGLITNDPNATFRFISPETSVSFQCALDGAAFAACPATTTLHHLSNGPHTFRARAVDAAGNLDPSPAIRTWRVTADLDADGYTVPQDCDDRNAAIHPNATDTPGDGIDQNCDGHDAAFPPIETTASASWRYFRRYTKLTALTLTGVPKGATIKLTCRAPRHGCSFKHRTLHGRHGRVPLGSLLRKAKLGKGARVEVQVTAPATIGTSVRLTVKKLNRPPVKQVRCLPPGATRPTAC